MPAMAGVCNTYVIDGEYKKVITYGLLCVRNDKLYYKPFYPGTKIATHTVDLNQAMKRTGNKWMPADHLIKSAALFLVLYDGKRPTKK